MDVLLRGSPEFLHAALRGQVPGVTRVGLFGTNNDVDVATPVEDIWGGEGIIPKPTVDEAWEIVGGAADTAAGTGARTVSLTTMAGTYAQTTQTVALTGTTAAPLTGLHRFANVGLVLTAGSGGAPSQPLIIRVPGGGPVRAYIGTDGFLNQAHYTVPLGFTLETHSLLIGLRTVETQAESVVLTQGVTDFAGRRLSPLRLPLIAPGTSVYRHELAGGLVPYARVLERQQVTIRTVSTTKDNASLDANVLGLLYDNTMWPPNSLAGLQIPMRNLAR